MKKLLSMSALVCTLALTACGEDTSGISSESSKTPKGNANSPVILAEYADLQCPACKAAHTQILAPLLEKYGNTVRFEFNHFPIRSIHRYALDAAKAAECAADQGKFWEYLDHTFENQSDMAPEAFEEWAVAVGVGDIELFNKCQKSDAKKDVILASYTEGREKGVSGTPTFFVNGEKVSTGLEEIGAALEEALKNSTQRL